MADACTAFAMRGVEGRGSLRVWELRKTGGKQAVPAESTNPAFKGAVGLAVR